MESQLLASQRAFIGRIATVDWITAQKEQVQRGLASRTDRLTLVKRGTKVVSVSGARSVVGPGDLLIAGRRFVADVTNIPDAKGRFESLEFSFPLSLIREVSPYSVAHVVDTWKCAHLRNELSDAIDRAHTSLQSMTSSPRLKWLRSSEVLEQLSICGYSFRSSHPSARELMWDLVSVDPSRDWHVADVAAHCAVSSATLRRRLQACGETFTGLLREIRMEMAVRLLKTTGLPIAAVAGQVGFESPSKFTAAFKLRFGLLPSLARGSGSGFQDCASSARKPEQLLPQVTASLVGDSIEFNHAA